MSVCVYAKREPLTLSHPAREVGVLKRHGVGEGESEVGTERGAALTRQDDGRQGQTLPRR
jgi:hypothetical protein